MAQTLKFLRGELLLVVRQHSYESQLCQLAITERQAKASASDIPKPLNVVGHMLIVPLFDHSQIREPHLLYSCEEVLVELLLQIGPCKYGVWRQGGEPHKGGSRHR